MKKEPILLLESGPKLVLSYLPFRERLEMLSQHYCGIVITPVAGPDQLVVKQIGAFEIRSFVYCYGNSIRRNLSYFIITIYRALVAYYLHNIKYRAVVSTNPLLTGLIAILIGKLTGAKTIIEINGNFKAAVKHHSQFHLTESRRTRLKEKISITFIKMVTRRADMLRLLYPDQMKQIYPELSKERTACFAEFVSSRPFIDHEKSDGKYILSLGHPWYLKGMDLLIQAFNQISDQFPDYRLKIVGHCPNGFEYFRNFAGDNQNIEFCKPVHFDEVVRLITGCSLLALASRTEAMGRVLLEAMASNKPVVAAEVDGIPTVVKNGFNGLLFQSENISDLADCLLRLLSDHKLAQKLTANGYQYLISHFSEKHYIENFRVMINRTLRHPL